MSAPLRLLSVLLLVPALTGCSGIRKALGITQSLEKERVTALEPRFPPKTLLCPGGNAEFMVDVVLEDGRRLRSEGLGGGRVAWDSFRFEAQNVKVTWDHRVVVSEDPRLFGSRPPLVLVSAVGHALPPTPLIVPLRFDCAYSWDVSGKAGEDGADGEKGADSVPLGASAQSGTNGGDATDGVDGGDLEVWAALVHAPNGKPLLQVRVRAASNEERFFLIDPDGGRLTLRSVGGAGGDGGDGGAGGEPTAHGGDGGKAGRGGDGGKVRLFIDEDARPYSALISIVNDGGEGGAGGSRGDNGAKAPGAALLTLGRALDLGGLEGEDGAPGSVTSEFLPLDPLW